MGLHLLGTREFGICTSYHQVLPARCSAPRITTNQLCSTPTRSDYAGLGLVPLPSRWSATIFLWLAYRCAIITFFSTFRLLRFWIPWSAIHQQQLTIMTSSDLSSLDIIYPDHRCLFSQVISLSPPLHRCRLHLDLRRRKMLGMLGIPR